MQIFDPTFDEFLFFFEQTKKVTIHISESSDLHI